MSDVTERTRHRMECACCKEWIVWYDNEEPVCRNKYCSTRTDPRDELIKKLVGASDRALRWMYSEIKSKKDSDENSYNPFVQLYEALAEAKQLGY